MNQEFCVLREGYLNGNMKLCRSGRSKGKNRTLWKWNKSMQRCEDVKGISFRSTTCTSKATQCSRVEAGKVRVPLFKMSFEGD